VSTATPSNPRTTPPAAWQEFARAPLVPVAIVVTLGLVGERYVQPPGEFWIAVSLGSLLAWMVAFVRRSKAAGLWLCLAAGGAAGGYLHVHTRVFPPDDIGEIARETFAITRLRGSLTDEPITRQPARSGPLLTLPQDETSTAVIEVSERHTADGWQPAVGKARLMVEGRMADMHLGDRIEVVGRLSKPSTAANPGEWDTRARLLDQRITAEIRVDGSSPPLVRLEEGWRSSLLGWLAVLRGWAARTLLAAIPAPESGIAAALLLGDGSAMDREEWDAFIRTGVVHVLAISGQHLVILAGFIWFVLRIAGVRRRRGAWLVALLIIAYAILTGGRPSAVRAAVMVTVLCGSVVLRRPVMHANAFALAWLVVVGLNPADPFNAGCQLSFLAVFVLIWFAGPMLLPAEPDPVKRLIDEHRAPLELALRSFARWAAVMYFISLVLGLANAPLLLYWQNLFSLVGIVLGPPLIVLTSIALIVGFLLLLVSWPAPWAVPPLAWVVTLTLAACSVLVHFADRLPYAAIYAPAPSTAWVAGFYLLFGLAILLENPWRRRAGLALMVWSVGGLLLTSHGPANDELRATFLSVGHGGCVVLETPDGRVLLYDAGTTLGPDVVRRTIAPYLWHRGVGRIDEIFVSHADLDHFNGIPELLRRFAVGKVTFTPSFAERASPGVQEVLKELDRRGVERRIASAGDRFVAGEVEFEVLHPPPEGPRGIENARSLVLAVRHAGHTILLTGDIEHEGLAMLLERKAPVIDAILAPHHGSKSANTSTFASWAKPKLVVSSQKPSDAKGLKAVYEPLGAKVWDTASSGAITLHSHRTGLTAEAFRTKERLVVQYGERRK